jgi:hypothetical protein
VFERLAEAHALIDPARGYVETGSLVALRGILLGSNALTLISLAQIDHEQALGQLAPLDFPLEHTERQIGITLLEGALPNRLLGDFIEILGREAAHPAAAVVTPAASGL